MLATAQIATYTPRTGPHLDGGCRAGRRAVYGHGRKFADRNRVGFVAHGTVTNQAVTVRAVRLRKKG